MTWSSISHQRLNALQEKIDSLEKKKWEIFERSHLANDTDTITSLSSSSSSPCSSCIFYEDELVELHNQLQVVLLEVQLEELENKLLLAEEELAMDPQDSVLKTRHAYYFRHVEEKKLLLQRAQYKHQKDGLQFKTFKLEQEIAQNPNDPILKSRYVYFQKQLEDLKQQHIPGDRCRQGSSSTLSTSSPIEKSSVVVKDGLEALKDNGIEGGEWIVALNSGAKVEEISVNDSVDLHVERVIYETSEPLNNLSSQLMRTIYSDERRLSCFPSIQGPRAIFQENSSILKAAWKAILESFDEIQVGACVNLPPAIMNIFGLKSGPSGIYVRACYPRLLQLAISIASSWQLVILGNTGFGKSYFGLLMLIDLVRSGSTVVYQSITTRDCILFSPYKVSRGLPSDFIEELANTETYYLVDSLVPLDVAAKTVVISSCGTREVSKTATKTGIDLRYLPTWTRDEIQKCRDALYPQVTSSIVNTLYDRWGGNPRFVLQYGLDGEKQKVLKSALDVVDLQAIIQWVRLSMVSDHASPLLVHIVVNDAFQPVSARFASEYVTLQVYRSLMTHRKKQLKEFMKSSRGMPDVTHLRFALFESHAHALLSSGGKFLIRELFKRGYANGISSVKLGPGSVGPDSAKSSTVSELELRPYPVMTFEKLEGAQYTTDVYCRSRINSCESIDVVVKPNLLFRISNFISYPCKQGSIHEILNGLGNPSSPCLYFVVSADDFFSISYQHYVNSRGKLKERPDFINVDKIRQYALGIDFD
jgi:hypothetical protein